jgi:hypothetical protein
MAALSPPHLTSRLSCRPEAATNGTAADRAAADRAAADRAAADRAADTLASAASPFAFNAVGLVTLLLLFSRVASCARNSTRLQHHLLVLVLVCVWPCSLHRIRSIRQMCFD